MKNKLIYLALAGLISCSSFPKKDEIFKGGENMDKYVNSILVDLNNDKKPDILLAGYDMNENGKIDTYAMFKILFLEYPTIKTEKVSRAVYVDFDEDEKMDYLLLDEDADGVLEKKVKYSEKEKVEKQNKIFI